MTSSYSRSASDPYALIYASEEYGQYINSFCITRSGAWIISVTVGNDVRWTTYTRRSVDRGRTWGSRSAVYRSPDLGPAKTIEMGQLLPLPHSIHYYTVSDDFGPTWRDAQPLRYHEGGEIMPHPNCPCPLTRLSGGSCALLFCNNDGIAFGGKNPFDHTKNHQPVYVSVGLETGSKEGQPLRFSKPRLLCSIEGFRPDAHWRDLTYGFLLEDQGEYYQFYNAAWRYIQVNRVDPALVEWDG